MAKVIFLHPDLGIGGAERLVVDAALALDKRGHKVTILTAHHDPSHAFQETKDGQLKVIAAGDWLPRTLFGRCQALCASLRMNYITLFYCHFPDLLLSKGRSGLKGIYRYPLDWL